MAQSPRIIAGLTILVLATVAAIVALSTEDAYRAMRDAHPDAPESDLAFTELSARTTSCKRPASFCTHYNAQFSMKDCDGDGIADPYCENGKYAAFRYGNERGFLSSAQSCKGNWGKYSSANKCSPALKDSDEESRRRRRRRKKAEADVATCVDDKDWKSPWGFRCADYSSHGWCANGAFAPGKEWTGSELSVGKEANAPRLNGCVKRVPKGARPNSPDANYANCGALFDYPGRHCCATCGRGQPKPPTTSSPTPAAKNDYKKQSMGQGEYGGSCTCPDGQVYQVGDNLDMCKTLACIGGTAGTCKRYKGKWSNAKVVCAGADPKAAPPAAKKYTYDSRRRYDWRRRYSYSDRRRRFYWG